MTRSELVCSFRGAKLRQERELDIAVFVAWRTATLTRAKKMPTLSKLLKRPKRRSAAERAAVQAQIAAAEAEFARLEARAKEVSSGR
ncbi:MAG: hypothetical protein LC798_05380 [Chloroflexi bacterium]|nr:hypothetical protein [Chloroflexota bacterium]